VLNNTVKNGQSNSFCNTAVIYELLYDLHCDTGVAYLMKNVLILFADVKVVIAKLMNISLLLLCIRGS